METNKIVSIRGNHSEWFEHAIFILKSSHNVNKDIVLEAERIINNYMIENGASVKALRPIKNSLKYEKAEKTSYTPSDSKYKKQRRINYVSVMMNLCLIICSVLLGALVHKLLS